VSQQPPFRSFSKDPLDDRPYAIDWAEHLPVGETLLSSFDAVWTITPAGLELVSQSQTSTVTTVRVRGGTLGVNYRLACHIKTTPASPPFELERSIEIRISDR
jgi:hypothetical protein